MEHLKATYITISTVVRCRINASANVPFDRKSGTISAYHNAVLYCSASRPDAVEQLSYLHEQLLSATPLSNSDRRGSRLYP